VALTIPHTCWIMRSLLYDISTLLFIVMAAVVSIHFNLFCSVLILYNGLLIIIGELHYCLFI
jgi:hypothetical protein